jgi:cytochrome b subunit of formate dehydrogenase
MADESAKKYPRFTVFQRIEHFILLTTFTMLALTGLPQKYATENWAQTMIDLMGGIETIRIIHHSMATLLMAEAIYHGGVISYKLYVLGRRATMLPSLRDLRDVIVWVRYNLGLSQIHPRMPRFNFGEKAEYLAVIWGTIIMAITGFMMWNPIATTKLLPGTWIPAARAAHGAEALLAVLAIITWHFYNVLIKRFNASIFTGKISHEAMVEEHAEELESIEQGYQPPRIPDKILARRKRIFFPYAVVMSIVLVGGLIWFITFEETAISTVPRLASAGGVSPSVGPEIGNTERGAALWPDLQCKNCHGDQGQVVPEMSSIPLAGTDISFEAFVASVRRGPADMPAYPHEQISDETLAHIWAWLTSLERP